MEDFIALSSSQTFQPGQTERECISVSIISDTVPENNETLTLMLSSNDPDVTPDAVSAVGIIQDNDGRSLSCSVMGVAS